MTSGDVMADLTDGPDRILQGEVGQYRRRVLEHPEHDAGGAHLQKRRVLTHIGVAHDHVEPPVLFGIGMRFVPSIDDRATPGGGRGNAFPDVLGPLAQTEYRATGSL